MIEQKDMIGVKDDIGELTEKQIIETNEREYETIKNSIKLAEDQLSRYKKQVERIEKIWAIELAPGNFRMIKPTMKFHEDEAYWKLQEQEQWDKIRQERQVHTGTVKRIEKEIKNLKIDLKDKKEFLKTLGKKDE